MFDVSQHSEPGVRASSFVLGFFGGLFASRSLYFRKWNKLPNHFLIFYYIILNSNADHILNDIYTEEIKNVMRGKR